MRLLNRLAARLRWGDIVIWPNKSFEWQFETRDSFTDLFVCEFWRRAKKDHAGIGFEFCIPKLFWMEVNIHDHRHWDYVNNKYEDR